MYVVYNEGPFQDVCLVDSPVLPTLRFSRKFLGLKFFLGSDYGHG